MQALNGTRPTVVPIPSMTGVTLADQTGTAPRFLDRRDDETVRAFATRRRKTLCPPRDHKGRASYRMMKQSAPLWRRALNWGQPSRNVFVGIAAMMGFTAFSAGVVAHWTLTL